MIPHLLARLASAGPTTTTAKSSSGSSLSFLILLALVAGFYFLVIRPRAQRQRQARTAAAALEVGSPAMSVGGIKGTVVDIDGDDVRMEVSPGVVLTFTRRAVNAQATPAAAPTTDADEPPVAGEVGPEIPFGESSAQDGPTGGAQRAGEDEGGQAGTGTGGR